MAVEVAVAKHPLEDRTDWSPWPPQLVPSTVDAAATTPHGGRDTLRNLADTVDTPPHSPFELVPFVSAATTLSPVAIETFLVVFLPMPFVFVLVFVVFLGVFVLATLGLVRLRPVELAFDALSRLDVLATGADVRGLFSVVPLPELCAVLALLFATASVAFVSSMPQSLV